MALVSQSTRCWICAMLALQWRESFAVRRVYFNSAGTVIRSWNKHFSDSDVECPLSSDPEVKTIRSVMQQYAELLQVDDSVIESNIDLWAGKPPVLKPDWKANTMQAMFKKACAATKNASGGALWKKIIEPGSEIKKLMSRIWENGGADDMWNGEFWKKCYGNDKFKGKGPTRSFGWSSDFSTPNEKEAEILTVTATSFPFVGQDRTNGKVIIAKKKANQTVDYGPYGAFSTALRKGECGKTKEFELKIDSEGPKQVTVKSKHVPANVFMTTYESKHRDIEERIEERRQVRTGALAFEFSGKKEEKAELKKQAVEILSKIVEFALLHPVEISKPRVRFTQLMGNWFGHEETGYIKDQTAVIKELKDKHKNTLLSGLKGEDIVELRYATNGWGVDGIMRESKNKTHEVNLPAFFTYLRWVGEDLGKLAKDSGFSLDVDGAKRLHSGQLIDNGENIWLEYCGDVLPIWDFGKGVADNKSHALTNLDWLLPDPTAQNAKTETYCDKKKIQANTEDLLGRTLRCDFNGKATFKKKTEHFQCWNRNLRVYSNLLGESEKLLQDSEEHLKLQKLQVALDILYQLQAQRKPIKKADALACRGPCAKAHRTAELMQIAVLDTMLGIVTFSNCKSGLDRTGLYHALQSAIDQIHILYPRCSFDLGFIAVHFWKLLHLSPSGASGTLKRDSGTQDWEEISSRRTTSMPQCTCRMQNLLVWNDESKGTSMHMFDIIRNAVLKNMLEIGTKVTFSSTGLAGLKYGGYTAEYAAKKCKEAQSRIWSPDLKCKSVGEDLLKGLSKKMGWQRDGNPMIAAFLPSWVKFGNHKMPMAHIAKNGEYYMASDLVDVTSDGLENPMTACALVQDASGGRGS